jgi:hypothetical protein
MLHSVVTCYTALLHVALRCNVLQCVGKAAAVAAYRVANGRTGSTRLAHQGSSHVAVCVFGSERGRRRLLSRGLGASHCFWMTSCVRGSGAFSRVASLWQCLLLLHPIARPRAVIRSSRLRAFRPPRIRPPALALESALLPQVGDRRVLLTLPAARPFVRRTLRVPMLQTARAHPNLPDASGEARACLAAAKQCMPTRTERRQRAVCIAAAELAVVLRAGVSEKWTRLCGSRSLLPFSFDLAGLPISRQRYRRAGVRACVSARVRLCARICVWVACTCATVVSDAIAIAATEAPLLAAHDVQSRSHMLRARGAAFARRGPRGTCRTTMPMRRPQMATKRLRASLVRARAEQPCRAPHAMPRTIAREGRRAQRRSGPQSSGTHAIMDATCRVEFSHVELRHALAGCGAAAP